MTPVFHHLGDCGLMIELGTRIDPAVNRRVQQLQRRIEREGLAGILEIVPAYSSLLVVYNPLRVVPEALRWHIAGLCEFQTSDQGEEHKVHEIPVVYGGAEGPDLDYVAALHDISTDDVIRLHSGTLYRVYMIGFTPGYPYMGELPAALDTPRRETPRTRIPGGSVAIAQRQTGIYPVESPGGWQIIGRTSVTLFDARRDEPSLLAMGDRVRFVAVSAKEVTKWPA